MQQASRMIFQKWFVSVRDPFLRVFRRWEQKRPKVVLHTPEELECFKQDAIENRAKHY